MSYFEKLFAINVNDRVEKKNGLSYLSWAYAWAEVKKLYPSANYTIYENADGWNYFTDGRTCWVKTGVTIEEIEHIEYLPVMDNRNRSIPADMVTSFDVNKAIQRSITKCIGRHGLGLYLYAGEDMPEEEAKKTYICADCGKEIKDAYIAQGTEKAYGRALCKECGLKAKRAKAEEERKQAEKDRAETEKQFAAVLNNEGK